MNDHPIALREMDREGVIAHYQYLVDHLRLVRAEYSGCLNREGARLLTYSQLAAQLALTRAKEERP